MTKEEIISMAREVGLVSTYSRYDDWIDAGPSGEDLIAFAKLVAEKEREACAKVCEEIDIEYEGEDVLATWCASAIRARGQQ